MYPIGVEIDHEVEAVRHMLKREGIHVSNENPAAESIMAMNSNLPRVIKPEEMNLTREQLQARMAASDAEAKARILQHLKRENTAKTLEELEEAATKTGKQFNELISHPR